MFYRNGAQFVELQNVATQEIKQYINEDGWQKFYPELSILSKEINFNIDAYKPKPDNFNVTTHYEYGLMSKIAYSKITNLKESEQDKDACKFLSGMSWTVLATSNKFSDFENDTGFSAHVFHNAKRNEIVISFRGTNSIQNLKDDIITWFANGGPKIFSSAEKFVDYLHNDKSYKDILQNCKRIVFTGHSLGGWLAECTAWEIMQKEDDRRKLQHNEVTIEAVTFDSPGSHNLIGEMQHRIPGGIQIYNIPITTYLSMPNIVNTAKRHAGKVIQLNVNEHWKESPGLIPWLASFVYDNTYSEYLELLRRAVQSVDTHKLDMILDAFDPKTGMPKVKVTAEDVFPLKVLGWPQGVYEYNEYMKVYEKTKKSGNDKKSPHLVFTNDLDYQHTLKKCNYKVTPYNMSDAHKEDFKPNVWKYLTEYYFSNGKVDQSKDVDKRALDFNINGDTIYIKSGLSPDQLQNYVEQRLYILKKEDTEESPSGSPFDKIHKKIRMSL